MTDPISFRDRVPYTPIHGRPKLALPGGARVAVWTIALPLTEPPDRAPFSTIVARPPFGCPEARASLSGRSSTAK